MELELHTQPKTHTGKDFCLGDKLCSMLNSKKPKLTSCTLFFGLIKENAFEKIFDSLKNFTENGGKLKFYLNIDKKGNVKKIINSLLEINCEVLLFKGPGNDYISDFQYKGAICEFSKKATIYLTSGNFSLSGLYDGYNIVTEFSYDLSSEDKKLFKDFTKKLFPKTTSDLFEKISFDNIPDTSFKVPIPSIEEFTQKDVSSTKKVKTSIDDISIDIEIDQNVDFLVAPVEEAKPKEKKSVKEKTEAVSSDNAVSTPIEEVEFESTKYYMGDDALDIETMLFETSQKAVPVSSKSVKKEKSKEKNEERPSESIFEEKTIRKATSSKSDNFSSVTTKLADLSKTSIFMIEAPKITKKGASAGEIKIPTYLRDLIPAFWEWPKNYTVAKNSIEKSRTCMLKIVDTQNAETIITDENAKLFQREGENNFIILSDVLIKMDILENDIIRFIKVSSKDGTYYTCEIIRQSAKEYPIWEQFCTHLLKGSKRKYGMM